MGWFGDYENTQEVADEFEWGAVSKGATILEKRVKNNFGIIIYNYKNKNGYFYFIYKKTDKMYKPLELVDAIANKHAPKKWVKEYNLNA